MYMGGAFLLELSICTVVLFCFCKFPTAWLETQQSKKQQNNVHPTSITRIPEIICD